MERHQFYAPISSESRHISVAFGTFIVNGRLEFVLGENCCENTPAYDFVLTNPSSAPYSSIVLVANTMERGFAATFVTRF